MKQFKLGYVHCPDCKAEMSLENAPPSADAEEAEPQLVCPQCGRREAQTRIVERVCRCGAVTVLRDYALSAPQMPLRLFVTVLSKVPFYHRDGRGLNPRDDCTACTECFVCKELLNTQQCAWEEVPLDGLLDKTGLTQQYVYIHPDCYPAFEEWFTAHVARLRQEKIDREQEAARRETCLAEARCLECEKPLSLMDRFAGRIRHKSCPIRSGGEGAASKTGKRSKPAAKKSTKKKTR